MEELVKYNEETKELEISRNMISMMKKYQEEKIKFEIKEKKLREELIQAMEKYNVTSWKTDGIEIIYKGPSTRTTIDSTRLKKELPDIAEEYSKTSNVKSSVTISIDV
jgi:predicted phage-related endonuclease